MSINHRHHQRERKVAEMLIISMLFGRELQNKKCCVLTENEVFDWEYKMNKTRLEVYVQYIIKLVQTFYIPLYYNINLHIN